MVQVRLVLGYDLVSEKRHNLRRHAPLDDTYNALSTTSNYVLNGAHVRVQKNVIVHALPSSE